ncbi:MoaD/ThiS family protein [Aggregatimonas sangjinii]|uniref:Molybdopterin synthase sulfur carrier subunit n=1 Tax=Aggregatimonas sangjinii TaxID=2583587 RepID=A0A5B7STY9_9FLAO|nr:MoaD/ThiS family protein [Aggregatimonas sangjinii]QCX00523.1 MoaD/ThiS family protein [Aggregatimonas sangjinii]
MEVLLFGIARDIVGESILKISSADKVPNSVLELKRLLAETYPEFGKLSSLAVAVNSEYATDEVALQSTDEIAIIPPVSGG